MAGGGMRLADLAAETFHAYVVCDEPDELFARAVKNGAVVAELNDKDYGSRDFAVLDPEHDQLLTVGKAYSGLTDAEIAHLTQHFLEHTTEVRGRYRQVVPDTVLEVAFDSIQPSARHQSGFALRFPRIARIRTDKTPREIDTLETCRRLAGVNGFGHVAADH